MIANNELLILPSTYSSHGKFGTQTAWFTSHFLKYKYIHQLRKMEKKKENTINQKEPFFFSQEGDISCKILRSE